MFIEQGFKKENEFWKYLVGSLLVFIAAMIGQLPLTIAAFIKVILEGKTMPTTDKEIYKMFDSNLFLFLILISFVFALLGLFLVVKKLHHQRFIEIVTSRNKLDWKRIFFSFFLWFVISASTIIFFYVTNPSAIEVQFNLIPFLILLVITLFLMPIQTSTEELVFRGYLMQGFYNLSKNKWFPLVMTSVIFGTMHIFNPEVQKMGYIILIYYIGTGFFLGILTLMDEGTELALGFHAANNIVASLLITSDYTVFQTHSVFKDLSEPTFGFDILLPLFIFPILLLIFSKVYKWTNWKDKLTAKHLEFNHEIF